MGGASPAAAFPEAAITNGYCIWSNRATTVSVVSNTQVPPDQIAWLLNQFDALQGPSGQSWIIDVGPDATDVVGVADGTDGLASMPPISASTNPMATIS